MNPEILKYLYDIQNSVRLIQSHLHAVPDLAAYKKDSKTIDAVERRLAIIGEAMSKVQKIDGTIEVSNKNRIIGLRHILVHDYDLIDDETIWTVCKKYLPVLQKELSNFLNSASQG